ncbi:MAG: hypothetical protein E3J78_01055 [Candidatus Cloacimonadota bacterium]|nr:MAG: hypothetical protein E3J78_01055 [Candidatus Cloacimonadota bacterium]
MTERSSLKLLTMSIEVKQEIVLMSKYRITGKSRGDLINRRVAIHRKSHKKIRITAQPWASVFENIKEAKKR